MWTLCFPKPQASPQLNDLRLRQVAAQKQSCCMTSWEALPFPCNVVALHHPQLEEAAVEVTEKGLASFQICWLKEIRYNDL